MDKIYIKDLEVYAYRKVNKQKEDIGEKLYISLELFLDLKKVIKKCDLNKRINHKEFCIELKKELNKEKYDLIEISAENLAQFILLKYPLIKRAKVNIKRPSINKLLEYVGVEIDRMWHVAYIGIASNVGDKKKNIQDVIKKINNSKVNKVLKVSNMYELKAEGYENKDDFINCAVKLKTILSPEELIDSLLEFEKEFKQGETIKWGIRTIDLDILLYDEIINSSEKAVIPHPRMHERMSVLRPLLDIAPYVVHPVLNKRIKILAEELKEISDIKKVGKLKNK